MPSLRSIWGGSGAARNNYPDPHMDIVLTGPRVILCVGDPVNWRSWRDMREVSRNFLVPWEPLWAQEPHHYDLFCGQLRRQWRDWRAGTGYTFLIFQKTESARPSLVIGGIALNDVQRGISQKATLGYWMGQPFAGQGLMTEAAKLVCDFGFDVLKLNRIEASCLPHNEPSKKLLARLKFEQEGFAKSYLKINGKWEDHLLWGRVAV